MVKLNSTSAATGETCVIPFSNNKDGLKKFIAIIGYKQSRCSASEIYGDCNITSGGK